MPGLGLGLGFDAIRRHGSSAVIPPVDLLFTANKQSTTDGTSYTFSTVDLGTADADRKIIVGVALRGTTPAVTALTVGGIAARRAVAFSTNTNNVRGEFWIAEVPSGTTGNIVVTTTTNLRCGIGVWRVIGELWNVSMSGAQNVPGPNPATTVFTDLPDGSAIIAYGTSGDGTTQRSLTWTGVTEHFDTLIESTTMHSGASASSLSGDVTVTGTWNVNPSTGGPVGMLAFSGRRPFDFPFVSRPLSLVGAAQGVATDGTYIYTTAGESAPSLEQWVLAKYDLAGNLITSVDTGTDGDGAHTQLTNIHYEDGLLYVTANDYSSAEGFPQVDPHGWVLIYNASDLSFVDFHALGARTTEGLTKWGGYWWEVANDAHAIIQHPLDFSGQIAVHNLSGPNYTGTTGTGFSHGFWQGIININDVFYLNPHNDTGPAPMQSYTWNGSGFTFRRLAMAQPTANCGQSIFYDGANVWWAERTSTNPLHGNVVKSGFTPAA